MFLRRLIQAFLEATNIVRNAGRAVRRNAADFAMGVVLHLLAAGFLLAAVLALVGALFWGLTHVMPPGAALTIVGLLLLLASLVAWALGRHTLNGPRD